MRASPALSVRAAVLGLALGACGGSAAFGQTPPPNGPAHGGGVTHVSGGIGLAAQAAPESDAGASPGSVSAATGSVRVAYWSSTRTLDDAQHVGALALWLRATHRVASRATLVFEGSVRHQEAFRTQRAEGLLREGYVDLPLGWMRMRVGKQIVAWGRADGINPTDNISPKDLRLLVPDDDDRRFGVYAVGGTFDRGRVSVSGYWLPGFQPDVVPVPGLPPGVTVREPVPGPAKTLAQGAIKIERTGAAVDWSLSYFDGYDRSPDVGVASGVNGAPEILLRHHRIRVFGGDFAGVIGRVGVRGEAAYTRTEDGSGRDAYTQNPFLSVVVGADRTFGASLNVNAQYLLLAVVDYISPFRIPAADGDEVGILHAAINNQLDRVQHGATVRVAHHWLQETLDAELTWAAFGPRFSQALHGKLTYAFSDHWKGAVGGDYFGGERPSFFRVLAQNRAVFTELRLSF